MKRAAILFCFFGLLTGLVLGFLLANSFSRSYFNPAALNPNVAAISSTSSPVAAANDVENELSDEEIRQAIQNADARSNDAAVQLQIGMALYEYAKSRQDAAYLPDLERILKRAESQNANNFDLMMALGEITFVRGQDSKQIQFHQNARAYFQKALKLKPDNVDVLISLAATFLFAPQQEPGKALAYIEKSLKIEPRNELALIYEINALILENRLDEAAQRIENLQQINPQNPVLPDLRAQLAQKKQTLETTKK